MSEFIGTHWVTCILIVLALTGLTVECVRHRCRVSLRRPLMFASIMIAIIAVCGEGYMATEHHRAIRDHRRTTAELYECLVAKTK